MTGAVGAHYFVHYKGWKQTCVSIDWMDGWMDADEMIQMG
jgi:hypothetical protein